MISCSNFHFKLNGFFHEGKYCDVNIRVQEQNFPCHRVVLASASEYFEAMFGGCFKEKNDQEIVLQDIESKEFENVLRLVYASGEESILTLSNVNSIFHTASFLRIHSIEKSCTEFIMDNLPLIRDPIEIFGLTRALNITSLVDALREYIIFNFESFYADEKLLEIPFDDLKFILDKFVQEEFQCVLPFKYENLVLNLLIRWINHAPRERKECFKELVHMVNFEKISAEYIAFMLKYFKNIVEISDFESASGMNIMPTMEKSGSNFKLSNIEDSRNRLLLKEEISKYFMVNERFVRSELEGALTSPIPNPEYKSELGIHAYFEHLKFDSSKNDKFYRWSNIFSITKSRPDWFLSCETDMMCPCRYRYHTVPPQPADSIYCVETFRDREDCGNRLTFSTYSSIDMNLPSNILTPPPVDLPSTYGLTMCATKNYIFLYNRQRSSYGSSNEYFNRKFYYYIYEIDKWFPFHQTSDRGEPVGITTDDNLIYMIEKNRGLQALDCRVPREIRLPNSIYEHWSETILCALNGKIYVGHDGQDHYWETYDIKAGKWRMFESPSSRHSLKYEDFIIEKMVPYDNMLWCIGYSDFDTEDIIYQIASFNPVSEEWFISNALNETLLNHEKTLKEKNPSYHNFRHYFKDIVIFKTP